MTRIVTRSAKETQKVAKAVANMLRSPTSRLRGPKPLRRAKARSHVIFGSRTSKNRAIVIALEGNLGSGKTTFVQGFARALGIKENVLSPTFVLLKTYKLQATSYKHLIHIDCYRLDSPKDLLHLGFKDLLKDKDAVILIEWANRVRSLLPKNAVWILFKPGKRPNERILEIRTRTIDR